MSISALVLIRNIQLPAAVATQYTCPSSAIVTVQHAVFTNTSAAAVAVTAYVVPSGQTAANASKVIDAYTVAAHTSYVSPELTGVVLGSGDSIQCFAVTGSAVSLYVSGIKQT